MNRYTKVNKYFLETHFTVVVWSDVPPALFWADPFVNKTNPPGGLGFQIEHFSERVWYLVFTNTCFCIILYALLIYQYLLVYPTLPTDFRLFACLHSMKMILTAHKFIVCKSFKKYTHQHQNHYTIHQSTTPAPDAQFFNFKKVRIFDPDPFVNFAKSTRGEYVRSHDGSNISWF